MLRYQVVILTLGGAMSLARLPGVAAAAQSPVPADWHARGVFLSEEHLASLRERIARKVEPTYAAWVKLKQSAEGALEAQPHARAEWYVPGYYVDAKGHAESKSGLMNDANSAYELALCYRMTDDERYARAAARLIDAWPRTVQTMSRKDDSTLCFSYHFPAMIFAADLLKRWPGWPAASQDAFRQWVREKALPMNTMSAANNWGNWGLVLEMASAALLDDRALFEKGIARWKELLEAQIAPDGHLPHEVNRNGGRSGIWYSHFSLMPQTLAAEIARVNGVELYDTVSPSGHTLRQAFERIAAWTRAPETFPYWKGDLKELHGRDYVSYFEILNAHWANPDATALLAKLRPLSASHCAPDLTFTHGI